MVSLALAKNILAALTGSAFGGLTIALDLLSQICTVIVSRIDIDPALMHRVAVIGSCTLDVLRTSGDKPAFNLWDGPQQSYLDLVLAGIVTELLGLVAVIVLDGLLGAFQTARAVT
ncbi:hypothetical protein [Bradyrhizobium manausense]|uniref:Uncharacterized protein n=1 Tax=Bradyrhizobium manausense TaxID=989370 RepID=A0A0R3E5R9_9BRAD|nr:hypothetical protein [Bradyrhizobium manausense]KRQ17424.1 hypothetical protein AOQ71_01895 [Bradyrhizobium manausense]